MILAHELLEHLKAAGSVVVITGSGISAESGVPTFRGEEGLWKNFRAEELATPQAFHSDPRLVWEWYDWRRSLIGKAKPNPAHEVIAQMEEHYPSFLLITQNVDGLHRKAGSKKLVEIHGNIWQVRCTADSKEYFNYDVPIDSLPPKCECGALLRPSVVWFGESLPVNALNKALEHIQDCDVLLTVGTSGVVHPVAAFPGMAKSYGAKVIELNMEETPISQIADLTLLGKAGEILPEIWNAVIT